MFTPYSENRGSTGSKIFVFSRAWRFGCRSSMRPETPCCLKTRWPALRTRCGREWLAQMRTAPP